MTRQSGNHRESGTIGIDIHAPDNRPRRGFGPSQTVLPKGQRSLNDPISMDSIEAQAFRRFQHGQAMKQQTRDAGVNGRSHRLPPEGPR